MAAWRTSEKVVLSIVVGCVLGLITLAFLIETSVTQSLDETIIRMLRRDDDLQSLIGPKWFQESARDYTALGGYSVLLTLTALVYAFLRLEGRKHTALFIVVVVVSGYLMSMVLKDAIDRPRPQVVPHLSRADSGIGGPSFPSGHSTMSTVVYVTLALMLSELSSRRRVKAFLLTAPLAIAFAVGASRVMMGVHYPTDVLGGWFAGLGWALGAWLILRHWRRRQASLHHATSESELSTRW